MKHVLLAGGYGLVGGLVARRLRATSSRLEITLAGRNPDHGATLAQELGHATTLGMDTSDPARALDAAGVVDLVVSTVSDTGDLLTLEALRRGIPHIGITRTPQDIAPLVMAAMSGCTAPLAVFGHWQAGALTLAALDLCSGLRSVERVWLSALYDPEDPVGATAKEDSAEFLNVALLREAGLWKTLSGQDSPRAVTPSLFKSFEGIPMGVLDVPSIAARTGARDIRFDIGVGVSLGRSLTGLASHDLVVELSGTDESGRKVVRERVLTAPRGQAWLTSIMVALAAERLLGLAGERPLDPGLYLPETLLRPQTALAKLLSYGVGITDYEERVNAELAQEVG
jgi:hypothetical protein